MQNYITQYIELQKKTMDLIPANQVVELIQLFKRALDEERQIFVFGNGGSAASATHFATDLGKGSSDKTHKRFRCQSLNDNTGWLTALGNDYAFEDIFVRQLMNLAKPGDMMYTMSVSGNSPNLVKSTEWCRKNQIHSVALVGGNKGKLSELADTCIIINEKHYGRVEDAHMTICHMIAFAFMERPELQGG
jgi:D-sedoheptulose 7-phosphate isomerase